MEIKHPGSHREDLSCVGRVELVQKDGGGEFCLAMGMRRSQEVHRDLTNLRCWIQL